MDHATAQAALAKINQSQVLRFWDKLPEPSRKKLLSQIAALDLPLIAQLAESHVKLKPPVAIPDMIKPVDAYPYQPDPAHTDLYAKALDRGRELLRAGRIAAFLVAGGQGTRLGHPGPKGEFPITPVRRKPLFQLFAEQLRAHNRDVNRTIPWYIMTSQANDGATRDFFARNNYFDYPKSDIFFFQQGLMPAFNQAGKLLLESPDSLALSPDGHGGSLAALRKSGALADMARRGVEQISYFQVDNPLVHVIDLLFLGLHALTNSEMSSKTIPKSGPLEKVGNFVFAPRPAQRLALSNVEGRPLGNAPALSDVEGPVVQVIEYSDLPDTLARQHNPDGSLTFNAGSIAIHALSLLFIDRLTAAGRLDLPWHRAEKKVPVIDDNGHPVSPEKPNAIKLEQFVFDAIPLAKNAMVFTTDRAEEFSPVKNAEGPDSPATCMRDQMRRDARWLTECKFKVPIKDGEPDLLLEISPLLATSLPQLKLRRLTPRPITPGQKLYLQ